MNKVLIVVITADVVKPRCWQSCLDQDYPNCDILLHARKPKIKSVTGFTKAMEASVVKYLNCADNREAARKLALASDADRFLFIDSDIVLPKDAITNMMKQPFDVIGGWYRVAFQDRYACGRWVADNMFINLYSIEPSLVKVDCIGLGCALFTRKALQDIQFEHGTDIEAKTVINGTETGLLLGECGILSNRLHEKGYQPYMDGSVVCEHLLDGRQS